MPLRSGSARGEPNPSAPWHHERVPDLRTFDAVVLAGGGSRRLGGLDKADLVFEDVRLIDRVVQAVDDAERIIAVGPARRTSRPVAWTREQPPGGGPAAGLAAALELVESPWTIAVAVDLPLLDRALIRRLVEACQADRAAAAVDAGGIPQPLLACYPTHALRSALGGRSVTGIPVMEVLHAVGYVTVADEGRGRDCDTVEDLAELHIERGGDHAGTMA